MNEPWQIELFGWLRATQGDRVVSRFRSRRATALLAYLAYFRHRSHPREQLIEMLWPECDPTAGQGRLSVELNSLRRQLEPPGVPGGVVLVTSRTTVQLNPAACVTDVAEFEAALEMARRSERPADRVRQLAAAAAFYRGELLPGCFEDWLLLERQRLEEAFLQGLHELVRLCEEQGDLPGALQWARRAVAVDALREESHERLIRLLLESGQIQAARAQFEQSERLLLAGLGSGLPPEIRAVIAERAPVKAPPPGAPAGSRGKRRRRGAGRSDRHGLPVGPAESPGIAEGAEASLLIPRSGEAARPSGSLPLQFTRFFGREREIERLCERLGPRPAADGTSAACSAVGQHHPSEICHRLVTLTGPGGTGKTSLSLQAARRLQDAFPGGVWFVSLRELTDPTLIPDQILLSLRLPRAPHRDALEQAVTFLASQPSLLLLDNFEHLIEGGVPTVRRLLEQVEHLTVLVTSRRRLGLEGERELAVPPLPIPAVQEGITANDLPLDALLAFPSVSLFVDRAQAVDADFQVTARNAAAVAGLCQQLEGLPLAIELAAARSGVLTPQQMLARMEQRFDLLAGRQRSADPRHRTLRATLDWSYQLLSPALQRLFARLSIFCGGWSVEAATAVCGEDPATAVHAEALDALEELREASLVQATEAAGEMRFGMMETIREFAGEKLDEAGEREAVRDRHLAVFLGWAEAVGWRPGTVEGYRQWESEHDNLRAALAWSVERDAAEYGLRLATTLQPFWLWRGALKEGLDHFSHLLALPSAAAPTVARAQALSNAGRFAALQHSQTASKSLHEESLTIGRALNDRAVMATALLDLGRLSNIDMKTARPLLEEALAIRRELGDPGPIAEALLGLADAYLWVGDQATAARALVAESLAIWRVLGDRVRISTTLGWLGQIICCHQGDPATARPMIEEALAVARELDDTVEIACGITRLGYLAHKEEDYPAARTFFEQCLPLWRELEHKNGLIETLFHLGMLCQREGDYAAAYAFREEMDPLMRDFFHFDGPTIGASILLGDSAADLGRWAEAATRCAASVRFCRGHGPRHWLPWSIVGMARVALARGRSTRAARLLGASAVLLAAGGAPRWPCQRAHFDRIATAVRARLEEAAFAAAWAEGETRPIEQIIAEALEEAPAE